MFSKKKMMKALPVLAAAVGGYALVKYLISPAGHHVAGFHGGGGGGGHFFGHGFGGHGWGPGYNAVPYYGLYDPYSFEGADVDAQY